MAVQVKGTDVDVAILGGGRTRKDLLDEIDDGIAARAESPDDLELGGWICWLGIVVWDTVGADREKTNLFALEETALTDGVTGSENILYGVDGGSDGRSMWTRGYVRTAWRNERIAKRICGKLERIVQHF